MKISDINSRSEASMPANARAKNGEETRSFQKATEPSVETDSFFSPRAANQIQSLNWINPSQKRLALERLQRAERIHTPYVFAFQDVGGTSYALDGAIACEHSDLSDAPTKIFTNEGVAWSQNQDKTSYFILLPGDHTAIGPLNIGALVGEKTNIAEICEMLEICSYEDDFQNEPTTRQWWEERSRVTYCLHLNLGELLPKNLFAAKKIAESIPPEKMKTIAEELMVLSAGTRFPLLLRAGLHLGYDATVRSGEVGRTAMEQAERHQCLEAISLLRGL